MQGKRIRKIAIIGGGTSGWMAAALFSKTMGTVMYDVTLIESEEIGTVGVGEATIPPILLFNKLLDIDEDEFIWETNATVKLGIKFNDWRALGSSYFHPFGYMGQDMDGISFNHCGMRVAHLSCNFD